MLRYSNLNLNIPHATHRHRSSATAVPCAPSALREHSRSRYSHTCQTDPRRDRSGVSVCAVTGERVTFIFIFIFRDSEEKTKRVTPPRLDEANIHHRASPSASRDAPRTARRAVLTTPVSATRFRSALGLALLALTHATRCSLHASPLSLCAPHGAACASARYLCMPIHTRL